MAAKPTGARPVALVRCYREQLGYQGWMRKAQILQYWMSRYGNLSDMARERFVRRQEVARLTRYPDDVVHAAIRWSNLLADALSFANSAYEGEPRPLPPEPGEPSPPVTARPSRAHSRRVEHGAAKRYPVDANLAKKIGPIQSYEDTF
jgi:hypothetical protein